jgi:hypothetical protein
MKHMCRSTTNEASTAIGALVTFWSSLTRELIELEDATGGRGCLGAKASIDDQARRRPANFPPSGGGV